jgi:hypothetical protein
MTALPVSPFYGFVSFDLSIPSETPNLFQGRRRAHRAKHAEPYSESQVLLPERGRPSPESGELEDKPSSWEEAWIDLGGEG